MPSINCEAYLTLSWSEKWVLTSQVYREEVDSDNPVAGINNSATGATFKMKTHNCMYQ